MQQPNVKRPRGRIVRKSEHLPFKPSKRLAPPESPPLKLFKPDCISFADNVVHRVAEPAELEYIEDIKDWIWPKLDIGAWGRRDDGPYYQYHLIRDSILSHLKSKTVCVQAGGCCGMYPRLWSNHFDRVYTFEPDPVNFYCLVNNCQRKNIIKFNCAIGDVHKLGNIEQKVDNVGHQKFTDGGIIPTLMIDDLALDDCSFIQLDVEGYEDKALNGAVDTIRKYKPVIVVELNSGRVKMFMNEMRYKEVPCGYDTCYVPC